MVGDGGDGEGEERCLGAFPTHPAAVPGGFLLSRMAAARGVGPQVTPATLILFPSASPGQRGLCGGDAGAVLHWDLQGRLKSRDCPQRCPSLESSQIPHRSPARLRNK